ARLMLKHKISGLPVVDAAGNLVGILTESDFLRRRETGTQHRRARWLEFVMGPGRLAAEYTHESGRKVREVMPATIYPPTEKTPLEQTVHLMERRRIKRLPVMREKNLVGIITRANIMRAVTRLAHEAHPDSASDAEIRRNLTDELSKMPWVPAPTIAVRDGI